MNPREQLSEPLGRWNLYVGGAGCSVPEFVNVDLVALPGVDVVADVERLPFVDGAFQRAECDAVLEHVEAPQRAVCEIRRVLAPGGILHIVTPFCHPFHEYPIDCWRFSIDGLRRLAAGMEELRAGWRTGPTATILVFILEYVKLLVPSRTWRTVVHVLLGWMLFPLRYLDLLYLNSPRAGRIGNHCYLWLRKPE